MNHLIKVYLAGYNVTAFVFWAIYLCSFVTSGFSINTTNLLLLNIAQGMAILEIFHVAVKWIKSSLISTAVQVLSRLLILVLINIFIGEYAEQFVFRSGVIIVSIAWGGIELVRYSLYFLTFFNRQPVSLIWMRYSFFIVLYPIGVVGEWFVLLTPVKTDSIEINVYLLFLLISLGTYLYCFPMLYKYMWKQRRLKLFGNERA